MGCCFKQQGSDRQERMAGSICAKFRSALPVPAPVLEFIHVSPSVATSAPAAKE